jgi:hypothetical protein
MQQVFSSNTYNLMHNRYNIVLNCISEIRRLIMLRGLPGIRHESVRLACTVLITSPLQACTPGAFHLRNVSTNTIFGFSSLSYPSRGASSIPRWDVRCKCMNTWKCNGQCITYSKQNKHHITLLMHRHFMLLK